MNDTITYEEIYSFIFHLNNTLSDYKNHTVIVTIIPFHDYVDAIYYLQTNQDLKYYGHAYFKKKGFSKKKLAENIMKTILYNLPK